jgi:uncharacterized membrane protein
MILDILYKDSPSKVEAKQVTISQKEGIKRSLVKTISWRVIGTLDTVIISYIITGGIDMALAIGGFELVSKMALYFFHERAWSNINWGK